MSIPHIALLTFSETRDEFYEKRKKLVQEEVARVREALRHEAEIIVYPEIRTKAEGLGQIKEAERSGIDAFIFHIPIWSAPNLAVSAARLAKAPVLLLGNDRLETSSLVGVLAAGGGLDQCGIGHIRVLGDINDKVVVHKITSFCRAAMAINRLRGATFGCFGGRSLGIYTAVADANQWQKVFGIDVEHIDQVEVIRLAEAVSENDVIRGLEWLQRVAGRIEYSEPGVSRETLARQIRSYIALRTITAERKCDFVGLKCQTELSDGYCVQCLGVALLNDGCDWDGRFAPVPCSCEADMDGALTMQVMRLISGGRVTNLMDLRHYDKDTGTFTLANCGSMPPSFAGQEESTADNWRNVHLIPHVFGKAGGAATQMVAAEKELTLARLCRKDGKYRMAIFTGRSVPRDREELRKTTWSFPHMFLKTEMNFEEFFAEFSSNHVHAVAGDYVDELVAYCRLMEIPCRRY